MNGSVTAIDRMMTSRTSRQIVASLNSINNQLPALHQKKIHPGKALPELHYPISRTPFSLQLLRPLSWRAIEAQIEPTMLRTTIPRTLWRPLTTAPTKAARAQYQAKSGVSERVQFASRLCTWSSKRPQAIATSIKKLNLRSSSNYKTPDTKLEEKAAKEKLVAHPELVSTSSSTHALFSELGKKDPEKDADMSAGLVADLVSLATSLLGVDTDLRRENHQRHVRPFRRSEEGILVRPGRCTALPRDLCGNNRNRTRNEPRT